MPKVQLKLWRTIKEIVNTEKMEEKEKTDFLDEAEKILKNPGTALKKRQR